jgi:hypothetical protein
VRKLLLSLVAVATLLGTASLGLAQGELKPVATVSFAGYDKLKDNVALIGRLGGNPQLAEGLEKMLQGMTKGKGLAGLDTKRPWAVVAMTDGEMAFPTFGFIPVTNLKQLVAAVQSNPRTVNVIKTDGNKYLIRAGMVPLQIRQQGDWAIVTPVNEKLDKLPDPIKLLGSLPTKYDLAVRISINNMPEQIRQIYLAGIQARAAAELEQKPGETNAQYSGRVVATKWSIQQFTTLVTNLDDILLGWSVDSSVERSHVDLELTAKTGTPLAAQFAKIKPGNTDFAGLRIPGAAATIGKTLSLTDADVAQAKEILAGFHKTLDAEFERQNLSDDQLKASKQTADDMFNVVQKTVEAKRSDGGLALLLDSSGATLVFAGHVVDGGKLNDALRQLVKFDPESTKAFTLDVETYQGVRFHTFSMPTPDPRLVPLVGTTLDGVIGIADDKVLVAAGRNAVATLKKVLDDSKAAPGKEVPPFEINVDVGTIAKFVQAVKVDDGKPDEPGVNWAFLFLQQLDTAGDKAHITLTASPIPVGMRVRLEVEEGLLKAFATMAKFLVPIGVAPPPKTETAP